MIQANELRIGNWVVGIDSGASGKVSYFKIDSISKNGLNEWAVEGFENEYAKEVQPIPLTPEILEKAGFTETSNYHPEGPIYSIGVYNKLEVCYLYRFATYENNTGKVRISEIKHLHQLQNLYYCLTGVELNISLC